MSSKTPDLSEFQTSINHPRASSHGDNTLSNQDIPSSIRRRPAPPLPPRTTNPVDQPSGSSAKRPPPPLPPRAPSGVLSPASEAPPPYPSFEDDNSQQRHLWTSSDPRSSSTQSLQTFTSHQGERRKLLLIYIHGFMGNETSFQSFPAHVHNLLVEKLRYTHVVHTKVYPRYKSKKAIDFARDDFSSWLAPHESASTDVVLLGHSMGGLLSAEVVLIPLQYPNAGYGFRHLIVGTINFDTPFLGMHPGVVVSGLSSLFRTAPDVSGKNSEDITSHNDPVSSPIMSPSSASIHSADSSAPTRSSSIRTMSSLMGIPNRIDPNYNPPFPNDVKFGEQQGWQSKLHFIAKHYSEGLTKATKEYVMSHLEFGGCMADYPGLKSRYTKIRALEEPEISRRINAGLKVQAPPRVRFLNYYTASTGIPKTTKPAEIRAPEQAEELHPQPAVDSHNLSQETAMSSLSNTGQTENSEIPAGASSYDLSLEPAISGPRITGEKKPSDTPAAAEAPDLGLELPEIAHSGSSTPFYSADEDNESLGELHTEEKVEEESQGSGFDHLDPAPLAEEPSPPQSPNSHNELTMQPSSSTLEDINAPSVRCSTAPVSPDLQRTMSMPLPAVPPRPPPFDPEVYSTKDERKLAEKEHKRLTKAYERALKDRGKAIKEREKLEQKKVKEEYKEIVKQLKIEKEREETERIQKEQQAVGQPDTASLNAEKPADVVQLKGEEQEKPKRDKKFCVLPPKDGNGNMDPTWVRVFMEGVDEVGAHCGLFFPGQAYEKLVTDVAGRVVQWVHEDAMDREWD